jgi:hypothetical protein
MITITRPDEGQREWLDVLHEADAALVFDVYEDDRPLVLSAATISIFRSEGDVYVAPAAATIAAGPEGINNRISYTWLAADHPDDPEERITGTLTITTTAGGTLKHRWLIDVLRVIPRKGVREEDLFVRQPRLRDERYLSIEEGIAESGSITTIVDERLGAYADGFYEGGEVEILNGTNAGQWREVTAFVRATRTLTVSPAFPAAIDDTSNYRLRRSWEPIIEAAWRQIRAKIRRMGWLLQITDAEQLREPTLLLAIALALEAMPAGPDDETWEIAQEYRRRATDALNEIQLDLSAEDDDEPVAIIEPGAAYVEVGRR